MAAGPPAKAGVIPRGHSDENGAGWAALPSLASTAPARGAAWVGQSTDAVTWCGKVNAKNASLLALRAGGRPFCDNTLSAVRGSILDRRHMRDGQPPELTQAQS